MAKFSLKKELGTVKGPPPPIPPGRYTAELRAIEGWTKTATGKKSIKFRFEIVEHPEQRGRILIGWAAGNVSLGTKACEWIEALLDRQLKRDEDIDWDALPGKRAVIEVEHEKSYNDPNEIYVSIVAVYPLEAPELLA